MWNNWCRTRRDRNTSSLSNMRKDPMDNALPLYDYAPKMRSNLRPDLEGNLKGFLYHEDRLLVMQDKAEYLGTYASEFLIENEILAVEIENADAELRKKYLVLAAMADETMYLERGSLVESGELVPVPVLVLVARRPVYAPLSVDAGQSLTVDDDEYEYEREHDHQSPSSQVEAFHEDDSEDEDEDEDDEDAYEYAVSV
ncbi:hypothetical protein C8R42DRAFT_647111 [Lentinula raphanica]|nr:hypothetical protein C8R42DRAFT_647111 [Lentinula raphanica]